MTRLRAIPASLAILAIALSLAGLACLLPDNPYQRWQLLHGTMFDEARWIYERCHYDPAPIDIAVIGSSRTRQGVNAPRLQAELAARGIRVNVVNFSVLSPGRGTDLAIVKEVVATKHPRLIILGIQEKPDRNGHAAYKYLADAATIVHPGFGREFGYLADVGYLPFRQLRLFLARLAPGQSGLRAKFDPALYAGSTVDTTGTTRVDGEVKFKGDDPAPEDLLYEEKQGWEARKGSDDSLPKALRDYAVADERRYVALITSLAKADGAKVAFLYVPYFGGPSVPFNPQIYQGLGPIWSADFVSDHPEWYADVVHLTRTGARSLTDWLVAPVAATLAASPPEAPAGAAHP